MATTKIKLTVEIELQHLSGTFVGKDEFAEQIASVIEAADEGSWFEGVSEYETVDWTVSADEETR